MSNSKPWHVYLVRCADNSLYCGITTDLNRRLDEHNRGCGAKYTRSRLPVSLVVTASFPDRSTASKAEYYIKRQPSGKKADALRNYTHDTPTAAAMPEDAQA